MKTIVFTVADIRAIVEQLGIDALMDEAIAALSTACAGFDSQAYAIPARGGFEYRSPQLGLLEWMPALRYGQHATVKLVGYHPSNPDLRQLPTILSSVMTFDTGSGHLAALMDGTFPTALRTGAASAVASRVMALPESRVLGLIGCGAQAVTQLHALSRIFEFEQVLIHDAHAGAASSFAHRVAGLDLGGVDIRPATLAEIKAEADILCTATSIDVAEGPLFEDSGLKPSLHINAVGSDFPGKTELPVALLKRALVCPDFRPQAIKEGECQQLDDDDIGPDLVELVQKADRFAGARGGLTVFDSTGWALEDHVMIETLTRHGRRLGLGRWLEIECCPADPRNPYEFLMEQEGKLAVASSR